MSHPKVSEILERSGLKVTQQRLLLLKTILDSQAVFTAAFLEKEVAGKMNSVTVYRILAAFQKHDIIREVISSDVTRFYELSRSDEPAHPHFLCHDCDQILCLEPLSPEDFAMIRSLSKNHQIRSVAIQFTGICEECRKKHS